MKGKSFVAKVKEVVRSIRKGRVMTYGEVAKAVGSPGAARAVGSIMKANYDPKIPCHRVVRSDGIIGDYNRGGSVRKAAILRTEGVLVEKGKVRFNQR